jgi:NitT/TauT family transport system ATP-binding protein
VEAAAGAVFRPDVYRRALGSSAEPMPGASMKLEGAVGAPTGVGAYRGALTLGPDRFFDGRVFDPERLGEYLAGFTQARG